MPPSPYERAPPWPPSRLERFSESPVSSAPARLVWIVLIVLPLLFLIIGLCVAGSGLVIGSTRTPAARTSAVATAEEDQSLSTDGQSRRHKSEFRSLTRRTQMRKLTLDQQSNAVDRKTLSKREASEPSTSAPVQKATSLASPSSHSVPSSSLATATIPSNYSGPTGTSGNSSLWSTLTTLPPASTTASMVANSTTAVSNGSFAPVPKTESSPFPQVNLASSAPFSQNNPFAAENSTKTTAPLPPSTEAGEVLAVIPKEFAGPESLLQNASHCVQFTEEQLVKELKQHGTYNPDFMAWDVRGVLNFFERASTDNYDKLKKSHDRAMTVEQNLAAVEQLVKELNLQNCNLRTPDVLARLYNISLITPTRGASLDSSTLSGYGRLRTKRDEASSAGDQQQRADPTLLAKAKYIYDLYTNNEASRDDSLDAKARSTGYPWRTSSENDGIVGQVHVVPSGCRKRGSSEDGYLRLCSACQAIRRLPDTFFPPFLNEVTCDEDKACLYFYDYPHGKCRQKHLNLVVLKNVGTSECQLWKRYNLNVRVSCECFVDEMSFFAKYV